MILGFRHIWLCISKGKGVSLRHLIDGTFLAHGLGQRCCLVKFWPQALLLNSLPLAACHDFEVVVLLEPVEVVIVQGHVLDFLTDI